MTKKDSWSGKVIGNYRLEKLLGKGTTGKVFLAHHIKKNLKVAIKILQLNGFHGDKGKRIKKRFKREAYLTCKLNHPNIVKVYDVGEGKNFYYLVMEYLQGNNLLDIILQKGKISFQETLKIAHSIALALKLAHKEGIVHRDIKPANIIILKDGTVKLTDFGLAKVVDDTCAISQTGQIIGTIFYISPEQAAGTKKIDHRADFYSLGITLFQTLTGQLPYVGNSPIEVIHQHISANEPNIKDYDPKVPSEMKILLTKLMKKKPSNRFKNASELLLQIARCEKQINNGSIKKSKNNIQTSKKKFALKVVYILIISIIILSFYFITIYNKKKKDYLKNRFMKTLNSKVTFFDIQPANKTKIFRKDIKISGKIKGSNIAIVTIGSFIAETRAINKENYFFYAKIKLNSKRNNLKLTAIAKDGSVMGTDNIIIDCVSKKNLQNDKQINKIIITPEKIQLLPGQKVRFHVRAYNKENQIVKFKAQWIVNGGILNNSTYEAGEEAGKYRVYIKDSKTKIQASAIVEIGKKITKLGWFGEKMPSEIKRSDEIGEYICKKDNSIMVYIPEGFFWNGCANGRENERPIKKVYLKSYYLDKYELTWQKYKTFCKITGEKLPPAPKWGIRPQHPVVNISWNDATKYAKWANKKLPTEAQWEKAAKGGFKIPEWNIQCLPMKVLNPYPRRRYPWGNSLPNAYGFFANYVANDYWQNRGKDGYIHTALIGSFPTGMSPYKVMDMAGNVWEWCRDELSTDKTKHAIRGGSWFNFAEGCRTTRKEYMKNNRFPWVGVRFAK